MNTRWVYNVLSILKLGRAVASGDPKRPLRFLARRYAIRELMRLMRKAGL